MLQDELLDIALGGLAKNKIRVDKLDTKLDSIQTEIKANVALSKEKIGNVSNRLDKATEGFTKELATVLKNIPVPKDGIDGKDAISIPGKNGLDGKSIKGLDGLDGRDGLDGVSIKGDKGDQGLPGKIGKSIVGKDGIDGISVESIKADSYTIVFTMSDGTKKKLPMPTVGVGDAGYSKKLLSILTATDTDIKNPIDGEVLTYINKRWVNKVSGSGTSTGTSSRAEIESMFKEASLTAYKELTYLNGDITEVIIYTDGSKTTKLFTKIIGYNSGNIVSVSITDEVNSGTLIKLISYTGSDITSITSTYTP